MARIMAFDVGPKRVGIAVTDPLQIIANALEVIHPNEIIPFLKTYLLKEEVESFVVGMPHQMNNAASENASFVKQFVNKLKQSFPEKVIYTYDERFTSVMAKRVLIESGKGKKDRAQKGHIDKISATIILQDWMAKHQK